MMDAPRVEAARNQTRIGPVDGLRRQTEQRDRSNEQHQCPGTKPLTEKTMRDAIIGDRGKPPSFDAVKKPDFAANVSCSMFSLCFSQVHTQTHDVLVFLSERDGQCSTRAKEHTCTHMCSTTLQLLTQVLVLVVCQFVAHVAFDVVACLLRLQLHCVVHGVPRQLSRDNFVERLLLDATRVDAGSVSHSRSKLGFSTSCITYLCLLLESLRLCSCLLPSLYDVATR